jgi:hypothetical protein
MTAAAQDDTATAAPPAEEPAAKKKRGAERQMTKDDGADEDETVAPSGAFVKADAETLAKRRIIKVKRPTASTTSESATSTEVKKSNPFAMASTGSTVFGSSSGFGGTTTSTGFGGSSATGFGFGGTSSFSGFGTAAGAKPSAFGFAASTTTATAMTSVFGGGDKKDEPTTTFGFTSAAAASESAALDKEVFPQDVAVVNGEEEDECVFQVRSKSFLLVDEDDKIEKEGAADGPIMSSVPPSSSNAPKKAEGSKEAGDAAAATGDDTTKAEGADEENPKEEEAKQETTAAAPAEAGETPAAKDEEAPKEDESTSKEETTKKQQRWREMGTGPIRVLKNSGNARIVQRREASAGGMGYQLLVNAILTKESKLTRPSEKHVQLGTFADPPMSYLFKVGKTQDAEQLEKALQKEIDSAKSVLKE